MTKSLGLLLPARCSSHETLEVSYALGVQRFADAQEI